MFDETRLYWLRDSAIKIPGIALRPRIEEDVVSWGDTIRIRRVKGQTRKQADDSVELTAADGRTLVFAPLDVETFDSVFRPRMPDVPEFTDDAELAAYYLDNF
jgi:hypothetical protein